jgi:hypothetical protein
VVATAAEVPERPVDFMQISADRSELGGYFKKVAPFYERPFWRL